jgi:hypothetical protein
MVAQKISKASSKMNVIARQSVKEACIELFFFHIASEAELLHVKAVSESRDRECAAIKACGSGLGCKTNYRHAALHRRVQ